MYRFFNPNPEGQYADDCVVRGIILLTNSDWDSVYMRLCLQGFLMHNMTSSNRVWGGYLQEIGFKRYIIPNTCPDCYTVNDFCIDNPIGDFLLCTGTHVVAVRDGDYYDSWDSGNEVPIYYWKREEYL